MLRVGIRREDKSIWERRSPLVPEHVGRLVRDHGVPVCVESSDLRVFADAEFAAQGATIVTDLSDCAIILGVKEVPVGRLLPGKTYVFFSHTIKGQAHNMAMLRKLIELGCGLIDYERITDDHGRRLVFFGYHAGLAGMIDTLWSLGQRLLVEEGRETPLARLQPAHRYASLAEAEAQIRSVADACRAGDSLNGLGPIVCGFSGYGKVSQGAQHIYSQFEPKSVEPEELAGIDSRLHDGQFVQVIFREEHMVQRVGVGDRFELQDYYKHPEHYVGVFDRYLSRLTILVNCIYWESKYPRLVTLDALNGLYGTYAGAPRPRLRVIGDISCDINGSIECTVKATDPGNPVYVYDVSRHEARDGFAGNGPVIMAVDALPTELPRESSLSFSEALVGLVPGLAAAETVERFEDWALPDPLKRATILHQGRFTPAFAYMQRFL